jgi:hypothetical protein
MGREAETSPGLKATTRAPHHHNLLRWPRFEAGGRKGGHRVGVTGTFTLTIVNRLLAGKLFPAAGTPVDVAFSAIHIVFDR